MMSSPRPEPRDSNAVYEELARLRQENAQLKEALRSRTVIGQATGLLMSALDLSPDEAFAELAKLSSHTNRKVRDVAVTLVGAADGVQSQPIAHTAALQELLRLLLEPVPAHSEPTLRRGTVAKPDGDAS
jgi:hypothetical protein